MAEAIHEQRRRLFFAEVSRVVPGLYGWLATVAMPVAQRGVPWPARSAALLAPYETHDPGGRPVGGPAGLVTMDAGRLTDLGTRAVTAGIALQVHAIGDAAVRMTLDAYEAAARANPAPERGRRHRIEHIETIDPADIPRFGKLGVIASMEPVHATPSPGPDPARPEAALSSPLQLLAQHVVMRSAGEVHQRQHT